IEDSRGGRHVQVDCGEDGTPDVIVGEITADCRPWDGSSWTGSSWTGTSWTGSSWTGSSWSGTSWTGSSCTVPAWTGPPWAPGAARALLAVQAIGSSSAPPPPWRVALAFAVVAIADFGVLHIRFGRETCTLTWSEAALLLSLVLAPWPWVALVCPFGVVVSQIAARRVLLKIAFNAASMTVGAALATVCAAVVAGNTDLSTVSDVRRSVALAAATVVYFLWN